MPVLRIRLRAAVEAEVCRRALGVPDGVLLLRRADGHLAGDPAASNPRLARAGGRGGLIRVLVAPNALELSAGSEFGIAFGTPSDELLRYLYDCVRLDRQLRSGRRPRRGDGLARRDRAARRAGASRWAGRHPVVDGEG